MKNLGLILNYKKVTIGSKIYQTDINICINNESIVDENNNVTLYWLLKNHINIKNKCLFIEIKEDNSGFEYCVISSKFDVLSNRIYFYSNKNKIVRLSSVIFTKSNTDVNTIEGLINFLNKLNAELTLILQKTLISTNEYYEF